MRLAALSLTRVEADYDMALARLGDERGRLVTAVRGVADRFRPYASIFVGGVPMIARRYAELRAIRPTDLWLRYFARHGDRNVDYFSELEMGVDPLNRVQYDGHLATGNTCCHRLAHDRHLLKFGGRTADRDTLTIHPFGGSLSRAASRSAR